MRRPLTTTFLPYTLYVTKNPNSVYRGTIRAKFL